MSQQINLFVNRLLASKHSFKNTEHYITPQNLLTLRSMMVDKHLRQSVMSTICSNDQERSKWISTLRLIIIMARHSKHKSTMDNLIYIGQGGKEAVTDKMYNTLIQHIFCQELTEFKNMYTKHKKFSKIISDIETIRTKILMLPIMGQRSANAKEISKC